MPTTTSRILMPPSCRIPGRSFPSSATNSQVPLPSSPLAFFSLTSPSFSSLQISPSSLLATGSPFPNPLVFLPSPFPPLCRDPFSFVFQFGVEDKKTRQATSPGTPRQRRQKTDGQHGTLVMMDGVVEMIREHVQGDDVQCVGREDGDSLSAPLHPLQGPRVVLPQRPPPPGNPPRQRRHRLSPGPFLPLPSFLPLIRYGMTWP